MLVVYFLSAALGMPLWTAIARRYGKAQCLMLAMVLAIISFIWAYRLGVGDIAAFYVICVLSGMTIGADAMLLPSLLSDAVQDAPQARASAFGLWNFVTKLTMAVGAGVVLPLIEAGGYHSGADNSPQALHRLAIAYALLPCLLKAVAVAMVFVSPVHRRRIL